MTYRVRVGFENKRGNDEYNVEGWATLDTSREYVAEDGYTVEWDDGFTDHPTVRYFFKGAGMFNLEERV